MRLEQCQIGDRVQLPVDKTGTVRLINCMWIGVELDHGKVRSFVTEDGQEVVIETGRRRDYAPGTEITLVSGGEG